MRPTSTPLLALAVLAVAVAPAAAQPTSFVIDSAASTVSLGGTISFELASDTLVVPLVAQGTPGATLLDGNPSDGRTTFFEGTLGAEVSETTIRFRHKGTAIDLGDSGSWLPGVPADFASAAPAELAASFDDGTFEFDGNAALRELRILLSSLELLLAAVQNGAAQNLAAQNGDATQEFDTEILFTLGSGRLDFESSASPVAGDNLFGSPVMNSVAKGSLVRAEGGVLQLTVPVDLALSLDEAALGTALPMRVDLTLQGQIVALAPEPRLRVLSLIALAVLVGLRRWRNGP